MGNDSNNKPPAGSGHGNVLLGAVRAQRRDVTLGSVLVVIHQLAEVAVPVTIGVIIDRAIETSDGAAMTRWTVALAVLFTVLSVAGCVGLYVEERAVTGATHRTRLAVARRVLDPGGGVEDALPGEVVSLSTVETARIGEGVGAVILGTGALAGALAGTVVLLTTSLSLGLVVALGLPALLLAVQALSQPLVSRAEAHQEAVGTAAGVAADLFTGLRVLKGLGAEAAASRRYQRASSSALSAALNANRVRSVYLGITLTAAGGFLTVVTWIGGRQALDGSISVGQLVAALGITQFLVGPLGRLSFMAGVVAQARASAARIHAALAAPATIGGGDLRLHGEPGPNQSGYRLAFEALNGGTLGGVDLEVGAGQLVGLVATEPAEAAALISCLDGTAPPDVGQVTVDGVALTSLELDEARRTVLVSHHGTRLFLGSLEENVAAAAPPDADLAPAMAAADADEVIETITGGLVTSAVGTAISEGGRSLSGGQHQRIALARALAADPPILVLHEPTTAVDAATEHRIATGLRSLRAGQRTTLVVTSSPTLLAATDRVALLAGGRIVAEGTHAHLAATEPDYHKAVLS